MVGYSEKSLIDFMTAMDSYSIEDVATKQKIIASFYKILSSDIDMIISSSDKVFSFLLMLVGAFYKKHTKYYSMSYADIAKNVITHELNRALYNQAEVSRLFERQQEVHPFILMSLKDVSDNKLVYALSKIMILTKKDMQDLLVDKSTQMAFLDNKMFLGDSFASIEEVINVG